MSTDPTIAGPLVEAEPASPDRSGPGTLRIGALVVSTLLLAGALVFMFGAFGARDDATQERRDAAIAMREAREARGRAEARLTVAKTETRGTLDTVDDLIAALDDLARLGDRSVELAAVAQDSGANNSVERIDEYNDNVSRHNEVVDQWDAIMTDLLARIEALEPGTTLA
jgi:hypothetical protein